MSNAGSHRAVLEPLRAALRRINPHLINERDHAFQNITPTINLENVSYGNYDDVGDKTSDSEVDQPIHNLGQQIQVEMGENESSNSASKLDDDVQKLKSKGIECCILIGKDFRINVWNCDSKLVDLIISCPPPFPSRSFSIWI